MPSALTLTARNATGFGLTYANTDGAGVTGFVELNRAQDFASDDTIVAAFPNLAAGNNAIALTGIPNGTPFYVRARSSAAGATYSPTILAATAETALVTAYTGFSIDKAMMVVPVDVTAMTFIPGANTALRAGFPLTNLLSDDPQSTFQMTSTSAKATAAFTFQTSGEPIDTIAMLGTLANDEANWSVHHSPTGAFNSADDVITSGQFRVSPTVGRRRCYHSLMRLPAPTTDRFWAIDLDPGGRHFLARNLVVGLARASVNPSRGAGQAMNDMGSSARTRFGTLDRVIGWRGRTVDFEMSWMNEAEFHTKWAHIPQLVGKTKSVMAIPNSKRNVYLNDRMAFGPLTEMRAENAASSKHTAGVTVDSIY